MALYENLNKFYVPKKNSNIVFLTLSIFQIYIHYESEEEALYTRFKIRLIIV